MLGVSIIIPIYKGNKYISALINMVERNVEKLSADIYVEIVFVDDYPDEPVESSICCSNKVNIQLITNKKNEGIHFSRVVGLNLAKGEYVIFLDQDDIIDDSYIESQLKHIQCNDMVVCNGIAEGCEYSKDLYKYALMQWTVKYLWFYLKFDCRIISPGQCLIKKNSIPLDWCKNIIRNSGSDDYYLWILFLKNKRNISINRNKLYRHVYTDENTSLNKETMRKSICEVIELCKGVLSIKEIDLVKKRLESSKKSIFVQLVELINRN